MRNNTALHNLIATIDDLAVRATFNLLLDTIDDLEARIKVLENVRANSSADRCVQCGHELEADGTCIVDHEAVYRSSEPQQIEATKSTTTHHLHVNLNDFDYEILASLELSPMKDERITSRALAALSRLLACEYADISTTGNYCIMPKGHFALEERLKSQAEKMRVSRYVRNLLQKINDGWRLKPRLYSPHYICVAPDQSKHSGVSKEVVREAKSFGLITNGHQLTELGKGVCAALKATKGGDR